MDDRRACSNIEQHEPPLDIGYFAVENTSRLTAEVSVVLSNAVCPYQFCESRFWPAWMPLCGRWGRLFVAFIPGMIPQAMREILLASATAAIKLAHRT